MARSHCAKPGSGFCSVHGCLGVLSGVPVEGLVVGGKVCTASGYVPFGKRHRTFIEWMFTKLADPGMQLVNKAIETMALISSTCVPEVSACA